MDSDLSLPIPERRHFDTLDALRFFAFLRVFLFHTGLTSFPLFTFFSNGGENGVAFFFTLSGFLISYILFHEKLSRGQINLSAFMLRRILRIWPLYFLMAIVAHATPWLLSVTGFHHSQEGYAPDWRFTFFFLENYKLMIENTNPSVAPLWAMWSLCVEEHYYILWGLLFTFLPVKTIPKALCILTLLPIGFRFLYREHNIDWIDLPTNLDYFAFGGLAAYAYIRQMNKIENFSSRLSKAALVFILTICVVVALLEWRILQNGQFSILRPTILSILFSAIILMLVPKNSRVRIPTASVLGWLGTISYGLYLIHTVSNSFIKSIMIKCNFNIDLPLYAFVYVMSAFLLVVLLSALSYYFYERPFLNLKRKFQTEKNT